MEDESVVRALAQVPHPIVVHGRPWEERSGAGWEDISRETTTGGGCMGDEVSVRR